MTGTGASGDAGWYKDAVIYELHVRAFADSNGDGIGDFPGLIGKLDYLRDLGVTALWLLPFFPSPLHDDGYDIADYTAVHPAYGTIDDFRIFLDEAHRRGLRVIIELVLNHTSDQHPWFQRARRAPKGSSERDFYVWSDSPDRYRDARVIFSDYEQSNWAWDATADAWYWHRFYRHQPDLNYENPAVREAIFEVVDTWLEMGVDGLRLDAVPYLFEEEGTSSENLPATHALLKELRARIDARFPDRMLLAEANQWPEDAVAYFGDGDECQMAFHFPLMPRLFMAIRTEDRLPVLDIMAQTPDIPETCQWALFLRNHDELTLEMVTEEERLTMYRAYAPAEEARINLGIRHRLAPLLGNSRRRIELLNALLVSLPGTPVIYYGDEIGMGDNIYLGDRDGVRTPMQWSADRNAGFSMAPPQQLYLPLVVDFEYHHATVHVEAQEQNSHSLLAFMKRLLALRKRYRAFGRGEIHVLDPANHRVLAFIRTYGEEVILVVANLSRFGQAVELDLAAYAGATPVELFGRTPFWPVTDAPYRLTIGPHAFLWFALVSTGDAGDPRLTVPQLDMVGPWREVLEDRHRRALEESLLAFFGKQPWFRGTVESVLQVIVIDVVPLVSGDVEGYLLPVRVVYADRDPEVYLLAPQVIPGDTGAESQTPGPAVIAHVRSGEQGAGVLADAIAMGTVDTALAWLARNGERPVTGEAGTVATVWTGAGQGLGAGPLEFVTTNDADAPDPAEDGERVLVKFLRRINEGVSPEWEVGVALTEAGFRHAPTVLGAIEYRRPNRLPATLAVLQRYVPHQGDGMAFTLGALDAWLAGQAPAGDRGAPVPDAIEEWFPFARLLGTRLGELHVALAGVDGRTDFQVEPFTAFAQRSTYQSMRGLSRRAIRSLDAALPGLEGEAAALVTRLVEQEPELAARFGAVLEPPPSGMRMRVHGDFHLGQVLRTGDDLVIVDYEGDADRFIDERRLKELPLRDVADMFYSLRFAAGLAWARHDVGSDREAEAAVPSRLEAWIRRATADFATAWREAAGDAGFLPDPAMQETWLDALLLEKAIAQVEYRLTHQPDQLAIALRIALDLLGSNGTR